MSSFSICKILLFMFICSEKQHSVKPLSKTDDVILVSKTDGVPKSSDVITIDSEDDDVDKLTSDDIEKISKHYKPGKNMYAFFFKDL